MEILETTFFSLGNSLRTYLLLDNRSSKQNVYDKVGKNLADGKFSSDFSIRLSYHLLSMLVLDCSENLGWRGLLSFGNSAAHNPWSQ
jgi:hypothetical protein